MKNNVSPLTRLTILACLTFSLLLMSCDKAVYKSYQTDLVGNRWQKNDVKTYNFEIKESGTYDLMVDFSHVYGTQFPALPLKVVMVNPDQTRKTADYTLELRNSEGEELGDCSGDYCDLREPVFSNLQLAAGNYQVSVANDFQFDFVPNVLGIGIRVVKSK